MVYFHLIRVLSIIAMGLGVGARLIDFGNTPPGLNQDEASIGYEAWSLLHHGIDRNGTPWPIHLISWGSGQNALYAYFAIPFVAFGLEPLTVRLPMLLTAVASLAMIWFVAYRLFDEKAAWGATAVAALSPWHIMLSRWALESNVLPFVFLCGLACLVISLEGKQHTAWLTTACALFGLNLYAYGSAYLAMPIFVMGALLIGLASRKYTVRGAIAGVAAFGVVAAPIALFVLINTFQWDTVAIAGVTIPRLPTEPRFHTQLEAGPLTHVGELWRLLLTQRDGTLYNVTDPHGVLYSFVFFALAFGLAAAAIVFTVRKQWPPKRVLIALWIAACLPTGFVQEPNINRVNLLLMSLVFAAGVALATADARVRGVLGAGLVAILVLFGSFARDYFTTQRERLAPQFFDGLIPALQYTQARIDARDPVCVTGKVNMPYVYALFSERTNPRHYAGTVQYVDATAPFREVISFGRYTFGLERCDFKKAESVIARQSEKVPPPFFKEQSFSMFDVYMRPRS